MLEPGQRDRILDLLESRGARFANGQLVRLADVADLDITRGYLAYRREWMGSGLRHRLRGRGRRPGHVDFGEPGPRRRASRTSAQRFPQVDLIYGGEYQESNEAIGQHAWPPFPVALLLIYMILATLFRSYLAARHRADFGAALDFAGIVFGVGVFGYNVSFNLLYASVGLAGVVVNDALVLVDFINRARRGGTPLLEAVSQAGSQRLRPVILTTLTTVVALLPMALGIQGSSKSYGPFAAAIAFGLLFAMIGTLFVIPLSYSVLAVNQERAQRLRAKVRAWLADRDGASARID